MKRATSIPGAPPQACGLELIAGTAVDSWHRLEKVAALENVEQVPADSLALGNG
jgi:hypothetical protein